VKFGYTRTAGRPDVNAVGEADSQVVAGAPVNQVEIKIILKGRRIENFEGNLGNVALLPLWYDHFLFVEALQRRELEGVLRERRLKGHCRVEGVEGALLQVRAICEKSSWFLVHFQH
jgi:hypothetical protein